MQLPQPLAAAIDAASRGIAAAELARASRELSSAYRSQRRSRLAFESAHRVAYLLTRLPATYVVLGRILQEARLRIADLRIESLLDLGAGPGTALWAAVEYFPELLRATLVEGSAEWIALGKGLADQAPFPAVKTAQWKHGNVAQELPSGSFDLVVISYLVNELRPAEVGPVARNAWQRTAKLLVVAEPGTPGGFRNIREIRRELISAGAHMVAPCPHAGPCPMPAHDWCHFAERVQRSSEHRAAKGGQLGYEDEKYSYVMFARESAKLPQARILRHPGKHSGHVELALCEGEGLRHETISRKRGESFKKARKAEWGSAWE